MHSERIPIENSILSFRHLQEKHGNSRAILETTEEHLNARGVRTRQARIVDAALSAVSAAPRTKAGNRMQRYTAPKRNQWYWEGRSTHA